MTMACLLHAGIIVAAAAATRVTKCSSSRSSRTALPQFLRSTATLKQATLLQPAHVVDETNNVPRHVVEKARYPLHTRRSHPVGIVAARIRAYFDGLHASAARADGKPPVPRFAYFDSFSPVVSVAQNFDHLGIPKQHPSRSPSDTYYVSRTKVMRTHTSAHQVDLLRSGHTAFLVAADCYRRDEINATHYPVFHQLEGFRVYPAATARHLVEDDLRKTLDGLVRTVLAPCFNVAAHEEQEKNPAMRPPAVETRWVEAFFPFTEPSWELEVRLPNGDWLEVLGCGLTTKQVLQTASGAYAHRTAWAFGIGLERLAMVLFKIPDVRIFWSLDPSFQRQFRDTVTADPAAPVPTFKMMSKQPPCTRDIAFWHADTAASGVAEQSSVLNDTVRDIAGDLAESVELIDAYRCPKTKRSSSCYRIVYRSMERPLHGDEVNRINEDIQVALATLVTGYERRS